MNVIDFSATKTREPVKHHTALPNSILMIIIGPSGSGKTHLLLNLIMRWMKWDKLYLVAPSVDDQRCYEVLKNYNENASEIADENVIEFITDIEEAPSIDDINGDINNLVVYDDVMLDKQKNPARIFSRGGKNNSFEIYGRVLLHCLLQFSNALRQKEALMEVHIVSRDEGPIVCVTSIFTEYFDSEKRLDSESTKAAYKGVSSTTSSKEQGQPPQNSSLESRKVGKGSKSGEHNKAIVEADMDITDNLASSNTGSNQPPESQKITRGDDSQDNCTICLDTFNDPVKMKKCGHLFCKGCIDTQLQYKPVCPACGTTYGIITGNQPKGTMTERVDKYSYLEGYEECGLIQITYNMPNGVQGRSFKYRMTLDPNKRDVNHLFTKTLFFYDSYNPQDKHPKPGHHYYGVYRIAYLPNNEKGQKVLHLLHLAFDRQLIFTIGRSLTSGKEDMVIWNDIHHKTNKFGGPQKYGYPDPTYLDRVLEELAAKGVTEESERQDPETFNAYESVPQETRI